MDILRKAENLTEAYAVLDPARPLEGKWLERFYAERPDEASIAPLMEALQLDPSEDDKTIFTGHRGSGKTTELARLEQALLDTHTVVRIDVETHLNLGDVNYADLLVVLGLQVFQKAREQGLKLDGSALLLERLNALLQELRTKSGRRTMVIVDGLDRMYDRNQVRDLFCQGASALMAPRCRVIYTVPLALYHTDDFQQVRVTFTRNFSLPNVKTTERDRSPCPEGRKALMEVLDCRLMPGLLASEAAGHLIDSCGGLLKELIALARDAVLRARRVQGDSGPVQTDDIEYAARQVRNTYRGILTEEQYRELWRLYSGGPFVNSEVARTLLHNLSLLEYDGGEAWWAVHPIVRPLLEERADEFRKMD